MITEKSLGITNCRDGWVLELKRCCLDEFCLHSLTVHLSVLTILPGGLSLHSGPQKIQAAFFPGDVLGRREWLSLWPIPICLLQFNLIGFLANCYQFIVAREIRFFGWFRTGFSLNLVVQLLSYVRIFVTQWTEAHQPSLSFTISQSLLKLMSIKLVMPSNHLILCHPLLLLPSIFPIIRVFSNELALCIWWSKYWNFSFSNGPSNEYSWCIWWREKELQFQ